MSKIKLKTKVSIKPKKGITVDKKEESTVEPPVSVSEEKTSLTFKSFKELKASLETMIIGMDVQDTITTVVQTKQGVELNTVVSFGEKDKRGSMSIGFSNIDLSEVSVTQSIRHVISKPKTCEILDLSTSNVIKSESKYSKCSIKQAYSCSFVDVETPEQLRNILVGGIKSFAAISKLKIQP